MSTTIEITLNIKGAARDEMIALLSSLEFYAFEEHENALAAYIDETNYDEKQLRELLEPRSLEFSQKKIEQQNWNALWESNFEPVQVDDFCGVRAEFHPPFQNVQYEIVITPKMSFGTGHHATTWLMISEMQKLNFSGKLVADFGTGTGILAILAEKLGSRRVLATDIDEWSILNAAENLTTNGCSKIAIEHTEGFERPEKFDIILANINKNVLLKNCKSLTSALNYPGYLLISGLLRDDERDIITAFQKEGLKHNHTTHKDNWLCILFNFQGE